MEQLNFYVPVDFVMASKKKAFKLLIAMIA